MSIRVFLSCTFDDLGKERPEAIDAFRKLRVINGLDVDLVTMEDFGPSENRPKKLSLDRLIGCDMFLGLMSQRYGTVARGETQSFSHLEYLEAKRLKIKRFFLEKSDGYQSREIESDLRKIALLRKWHKEIRENSTPVPFGDPKELGTIIARYFPKLLEDNYPDRCFIESGNDRLRVKYFQMSSRTEPFIDESTPPKTVDIVAMHALRFFNTPGRSIETLLRAGTRIRVLVVEENSEAARLVESITGRHDFPKSLIAAKQKAHHLRDLIKKRNYPGKLELREMNWVFPATIFIVDGSRPGAKVLVGTYTPDFSSASTNKWFAEFNRASGDKALRFYVDQFEQMWCKSKLGRNRRAVRAHADSASRSRR